MNKVLSRLLIFFIGIPLSLFLALLPAYNHLAMHLVITVVSVLGAMELYSIFRVHTPLLPKPLVIACTGLIPLFAGICKVLPSMFDIVMPFGNEAVTYLFITLVMILIFLEIFSAKDFKDSNSRVSSSVFILLYCGFFPTFISRLTVASAGEYDVAGPLILIFLLMVFMCDSLAWFFGVLLGKNNRGVIKASPNKSIAGFIGGFVGSVAGGLVGYFIFRNHLDCASCSVAKMVLTGVLIAAVGIMGDLIESIFKRSAGVKDSGKIVIGRGGVLDSIDSILLAAPVFYFCCSLILGIKFS